MPRRQRRDEPGVPHGVMFHRFRAAGEPASGLQGALTPDDLDRLLHFVGIDRILSPDDWLERLDAGALGADDLCLTFDDGLRSQRDYALPVLDRYGLRAFFFVCSCVYDGQPIRSEVYSHAAANAGGMAAVTAGFLERCPEDVLARLRTPEFDRFADGFKTSAPWYSRQDLEYRFIRNRVIGAEQFQAMLDDLLRERGVDPDAVARTLWLEEADLVGLTGAGHYVGLHSWGHPYDIASLPPAEQRNQYERNRDHLTAATGRRPLAVAHPLNSYDDTTLEVLRTMDVACGFRANVAVPPAGRLNPTNLELAREDSANLIAAMEAGA